MSQPKQTVNVPEKSNSGDRPHSELDLYSRAIDESTFPGANLGFGYYTDAEYYQQAQQYKYGMFADAAFGRALTERAVKDAKHGLAADGWSYTTEEQKYEFEGWRHLSDDDQADEDRRRYFERRGTKIWDQLPKHQRQQALVEYAGVLQDWEPPQWQMLKMRHDASRSRDARLLDNLFGRGKQAVSNAEQKAREKLEQLAGNGGPLHR
jgi:hypothetical protein